MISAKFNFVGKPAKSAAPGTPARVLGSSAAPLVGKLFRIVANEKVGLAILPGKISDRFAFLVDFHESFNIPSPGFQTTYEELKLSKTGLGVAGRW